MAEEENVFIRTLTDGLLIIDCIHTAGSVVEVPASIGKRLVESKHAEKHGGPAHAAPPAEGEPKPGEPLEHKHVKTEKATR